jgi:hypothetical protein
VSYWIKAVLGGGLFLASVAAFNYGILELLETGTCASGGPYVVARPCPEGTGTDFLILVGSIFGGLIGAAIYAIRGPRPGGPSDRVSQTARGGLLMWTIFFTVTGGIVLYASLTQESYGDDAKLGGTIVGVTFLVMGLPPLAFMIWSKIDDWRDPPPDSRFQPSHVQPVVPPTSPDMVPTSWPMAGGGGAPPPAPAEQAGVDPELQQLEQLERLQRLRESGALTDAEFEQQKRRILDG